MPSVGASEQVQAALYRIADAASAVDDMQSFYVAMHRIVGELMYADYFYIALYSGADAGAGPGSCYWSAGT